MQLSAQWQKHLWKWLLYICFVIGCYVLSFSGIKVDQLSGHAREGAEIDCLDWKYRQIDHIYKICRYKIMYFSYIFDRFLFKNVSWIYMNIYHMDKEGHTGSDTEAIKLHIYIIGLMIYVYHNQCRSLMGRG